MGRGVIDIKKDKIFVKCVTLCKKITINYNRWQIWAKEVMHDCLSAIQKMKGV